MNKIFLETKIEIEGSLNLKNLSQVNNPDFAINELKKIKVLYKELLRIFHGSQLNLRLQKIISYAEKMIKE